MIYTRIRQDTIDAMKGKDTQRVKVLRLATAAIKQYEIDQRTEATDTTVLSILKRMIKQRDDAKDLYLKAGRQNLHDQECYEIEVLCTYLPEPMSHDAMVHMVTDAIQQTGAKETKDMRIVMSHLRQTMQGHADMKQVSQLVMDILSTQDTP
jgi:uncharacterized protein